jgi:hypothetical protein
MTAPRQTDTAQVETLRTVLTAASDLATSLARDPLLGRMLEVFARLPEADREPILRVLERDATWCRIVEHTADGTGIGVRPNPHASLYVHVLDQPAPLQRDVDVIRLGIERLVLMLPMLFQEGVHEQWTASAREIVRDADPEMLEYVARLAREVLALAGDAHRER